MPKLSAVVNLLFYFYNIILLLRIFLTWIPTIDWEQQPYTGLRSVTDPFLNIFKRIIPPIGGVFDISPILAFAVLLILNGVVVEFLFRIGL